MISTALLLGAPIGLIMGLTGAGGGILAIPALMMGLGLGLTQAAPIALTAVAIAAATGALHGLRHGTVRYRAALLMAALGSLTAPLGTMLAHQLSQRTLSLMFVGVLLLVAWRMIHQSRQPSPNTTDDTLPAKPCRLSRESGRFIWNRLSIATMSAIGAISGTLTGLLGVGGGFFIVPALSQFSDAGIHSIIATSLMVIALVSTMTVAMAAASGTLVFPTAAWFFVGAVVIGMMLGRRLAPHVPAVVLQRGFAVVCLLVASAMTWLALR